MATDKKVLTVQDISCFGQCSMTVALPIISACGIETAILPSAVLSTHTGGFKGFTVRDLTDDIPGIVNHWVQEGLSFDAIYTGYLGSTRQMDMIKDMFRRLTAPGAVKIVDPAMADHGKLYYGFDDVYAREMGKLCGEADIVLPNITEAALMTDAPYVGEGYDEAYIRDLMERIFALGAKTVVMTGVSYAPEQLGVAVCGRGDKEISYYFHPRLERSRHGTGDIFAAAFTGGLLQGKSPLEAATLAAEFTLAAMRATDGDETHWYGAKFEKALPMLTGALNH